MASTVFIPEISKIQCELFIWISRDRKPAFTQSNRYYACGSVRQFQVSDLNLNHFSQAIEALAPEWKGATFAGNCRPLESIAFDSVA